MYFKDDWYINNPYSPVTSELMCCEFNQNGELLAVGTGDGAVAVSITSKPHV